MVGTWLRAGWAARGRRWLLWGIGQVVAGKPPCTPSKGCSHRRPSQSPPAPSQPTAGPKGAGRAAGGRAGAAGWRMQEYGLAAAQALTCFSQWGDVIPRIPKRGLEGHGAALRSLPAPGSGTEAACCPATPWGCPWPIFHPRLSVRLWRGKQRQEEWGYGQQQGLG